MKKFICYISFAREVEAEDADAAGDKVCALLHNADTMFNAVAEQMELDEVEELEEWQTP